MGSPRCTATTETASVPTAATAPQARIESGFVILAQTCLVRHAVEHCGEYCALVLSQFCRADREEEVVGLRSPDNQERLSPHQDRPFGGRLLVLLCFFPKTCQRA